MKDLDNLTKAELKKLIKDTVGKKKKGKDKKKKGKDKKDIVKRKVKKVYSDNSGLGQNQNFQERLIQKPIMPQSNPQRMVQMPMFSPNVMGNMASMDQRAADVLRGEINRSENKLVDVETKLKVRSDAQLAGDLDRIKTIKLNKLVKNFTEKKQEDDPDFVFSGLGKPKRTPEAWRQAFDDLKNQRAFSKNDNSFEDIEDEAPVIKKKLTRKKKIVRRPILKDKPSLADIESSSINRDVTSEPNIVNVSPSIVNTEDNIDVAETTFEPNEDEAKDDEVIEDMLNEDEINEEEINDILNNDNLIDDSANDKNDELVEKRMSNTTTTSIEGGKKKIRYNKMLNSLNKIKKVKIQVKPPVTYVDWTVEEHNEWVDNASRDELLEEAFNNGINTHSRKTAGLRKDLYK